MKIEEEKYIFYIIDYKFYGDRIYSQNEEDWLLDNNIDYKRERGRWYFISKEDAMAFKLRWM